MAEELFLPATLEHAHVEFNLEACGERGSRLVRYSPPLRDVRSTLWTRYSARARNHA